MDLRTLRYFVACVENRTMHAAAEAVHVSQPALSKAIANLETELGVTLLDRHPRGVVPTPFGHTLFRYAKMIDSEMRRAVAEIDAQRGMTGGTIVIGVIPTMSALMGKVAQTVLARHPGLRLKLRVAFSSELTPALLEGELDLALLLLPGEEAPGLTFTPLLSTGPVVVVRNDHPLTRQPRASLRQLSEFPWLIPDYPASHRAIIHRAFIDAGIPPPHAAIDVSTIIFFDSLIRESDLVTVAPSTLLSARAGNHLTALETDFVFPPEKVGLAFREQSTLLPGARAVIEIVRAHCADLPGAIETTSVGADI
jgi:DNA-binding transcriptional LysR family regulator